MKELSYLKRHLLKGEYIMVGFVVRRPTPEETIVEFLNKYNNASFEVQGDSDITIELLGGTYVEIFTRHASWNGYVDRFDSIDKKLIKDRMNPSEAEMDIIRKVMRAIDKRYSTAA
jgi:hypothetical protein|nr:MAG TPA: hypothetical protein [Caudoviricetes sp.]